MTAQSDNDNLIKSGSLAGKTMWGAIIFLALPILIQQFLIACVGLADKMFAGALPVDIVLPSLDAIGIGSYIGWFISIAVSGVGIGAQALIARSMGSGDIVQGNRVLGQSITLAFIWGIVVAIALWFFAAPLGVLCQLSEEAQAYLVDYIRVLAIGMPACAVMTAGSMALHGSGDTIRPAVVAIVVNIVNVLVSWAMCGADMTFGTFELMNPFSYDYHVIGIAIGSSCAYIIGALFILGVLVKGVTDMRLKIKHLFFQFAVIWRIAKIGIPNFFEGLSMWVANLFILQFIGQIAVNLALSAGQDAEVEQGLQGAHIIAVQWEAMSFLPGFAIGIAAGTLAGQYLGAGQVEQAKRAIRVCMGLAALLMSSFGVVMIFAGEFLTAIISQEPIHAELVPKLLIVAGVMQVFFAIMMVFRQALKGTGDTLWTFLITSFSSWCIRLPLAWVLGVQLGYGLVGVWYALCGEMAIRALIFYCRLKNGGWVKDI
ncbi:MAG: MATE family efflux transporter [Planctomycetota bacterium]|nr:MATE family efflux transporter [Planctomycetota bacterium]